MVITPFNICLGLGVTFGRVSLGLSVGVEGVYGFVVSHMRMVTCREVVVQSGSKDVFIDQEQMLGDRKRSMGSIH